MLLAATAPILCKTENFCRCLISYHSQFRFFCHVGYVKIHKFVDVTILRIKHASSALIATDRRGRQRRYASAHRRHTRGTALKTIFIPII